MSNLQQQASWVSHLLRFPPIMPPIVTLDLDLRRFDPLEGHPRYRSVQLLSRGRYDTLSQTPARHSAFISPLRIATLVICGLSLAGAFGQVYHCLDLRTGGDVAVKTILRGEHMLLKYVRSEVQNHILLRHPNVVDFKVQAPCGLAMLVNCRYMHAWLVTA